MLLDQFYSEVGGKIRISPEQASRFVKEIAGDFNPIHDPSAARFCVPGDLLFALVLGRYGVTQRMSFVFTGMVGAGVDLEFPTTDADSFAVRDASGKSYLEVQRAGPRVTDRDLIEALVRGYVAFSGQNFPDIMVPLMAEHGVMINPDRPLVIYERMSFEFNRLDVKGLGVDLADASLDVAGKRGESWLRFRLTAAGEPVGVGSKKLLLTGLRPYEAEPLRELVERYASWKQAYRCGEE